MTVGLDASVLKQLVDELARVFDNEARARLLARRAGHPPGFAPRFDIPLTFWDLVVRDFVNGLAPGGVVALADAAAVLYPDNPIFTRYRTSIESTSNSRFLSENETDPVVVLAPVIVTADRSADEGRSGRFASFTDRQDAIRAFDRMLDCAREDWHCLVFEGLTGSGKSLLIDYLRQPSVSRCLSAAIILGPMTDQHTLFRQMCSDLGGSALEDAFVARATEIDDVLVQRASSILPANAQHSLDARGSSCLANVDAGATNASARSSRHLDLLVQTLEHLGSRRWVLFIDEAEHLEIPEIGRLISTQLVPRLKARFPGFRVVFAGQTVPLGRLSKSVNRIEREPLDAFSIEDSLAMLASLGVEDRVARRVHAQSAGIPSRLASFATLNADLDADLDELEAHEGDEWVARVRDQLIGRLKDEGLRDAVPYLALLDFFDMGLLDTVFGLSITDEQFDDLQRRQFIKPVARDRWRCHKTIGPDLVQRLWERNPDRCRRIYKRAFEAYRERMAIEEERHGGRRFPGRAELAAACLRCAAEHFAPQAQEFLEDELAKAVVALDGEYVLLLRRACAAIPRIKGSAAFELVVVLERAIEALLVGQAQLADPRAFEHLAKAVGERGAGEIAAQLMGWVAFLATMAKDHKRAVEAAKRAAALDPECGTLRLELARNAATAGDWKLANRCLDEYRDHHGKTAELSVIKAHVMFLRSKNRSGRRILTKALSRHPDDSFLRLKLAQHLQDVGDHEGALEQVDSVLARDPQNADALKLRIDLLDERGDWKAIREALGRIPDTVVAAVDATLHNLRLLDQPGARLALMTDIRQRPETVSKWLFLTLGERLAGEGEFEKVLELKKACVAVHPDTTAIWEQHEALALLAGERFSEALAILERQRPEDRLLFTPVAIAHCCVRLNRRDDARKILEEWRATELGVWDWASYHLAWLGEEDPEAGLRRLDSYPQMGPMMRLGRAELLSTIGRHSEAIDELETLVRSDAVFTGPRSLGLDARVLLIRLLVHLQRLDEAAILVEQMLELYPAERKAIEIGAEVFTKLGNVAGVERITRPWLRSGPVLAMRRLSSQAAAILVETPQPTEILNALRKEPDRLELAMALHFAIVTGGDSDRDTLLSGILEANPSALFEIEKLGIQNMLDLPAPERRKILDRWTECEGSNMLAGIGAMAVFIHEGQLEDAATVAATLRHRFPDAAERIDWVEIIFLSNTGHQDLAIDRLAPFIDTSKKISSSLVVHLSQAVSQIMPAPDAVRFHERIIREFEDARPLAYLQIASLHLQQGEHQLAFDALNALRDMSPGVAEPHGLLRSQALLGLGRAEEGLLECEQWLMRVRPRSLLAVMFHCVRGSCLLRLQRHSEATAAFRSALEVRPRHANALRGLSSCLEKQRQWEDAYEALLAVMTEAPELRDELEPHVQRLRARAWAGSSHATLPIGGDSR